MRALASIGILLAGCFSPAPPQGAPCDPAAPACPDDQACSAQAGGFFCGVHDGPGIDAPASDDAPSDTPVAVDSGVDANLQTHFEYPAMVAECVDPGAPDPAVCRSKNLGALEQMVVDSMDSSAGNPWVAYIRFAVDSGFAGKTIATVKLRLKTTTDAKAPGDSGEVWAVAPFVLADLTGTAPAQQGANPLAPTKGTVPGNTVIDFALPITSVTANTPAHFGIFPKASANGVNYWNIDGDVPPILIIDTL